MEEFKTVVADMRNLYNSGITKDIRFRLKMLKKLKDTVVDNEQSILEALKADLHKSFFESYISEVGFLLNEIDLHIRKLKKWMSPEKVSTPITLLGSKSYIIREPLGVALIISPWNYPFQLTLTPLVGAIAAGNCSILKLSAYSTHVTNLIIRLISEAFDKNYITALTGDKNVNEALLEQKYDYIFFTGSSSFGRSVAIKAAETLTPVTLELGGKSPVIVTNSANIKIAARRIVWGKFMNSGQTCIAPDYLFVDHRIKETLICSIKDEITKQYGESPHTSESYGRIIRTEAFDRVVNMIKDGDIVCGGDYDRASLYIAPTLIDNVKSDSKLLNEEIFGPILPIIEYKDLDQVKNTINSRAKPLALYVFSGDKKESEGLLRDISSGGACVNDVVIHIANDNLPFGGVGGSGYGKYHGKWSFDTFSNVRSLVKSSVYIDVPVRYSPYILKLNILRKLM